MVKRIFVSDCDGPITTNNYALELATRFIPEGDRVFAVISKYDEVLAYVEKRQDYTLGSSLKLILPFLMAFDVNNRVMEDFCADNLALLGSSKETLSYVRQISEAFVVSKSYEHCIRVLCRATGFPLEHTYCTKVNLDSFEVKEKEKGKLKAFAWEIAGLPIIDIPSSAKSLRDLSSKDRDAVKRLDKIFWHEIAGMHCRRVLSDVHVIGGAEKANVVRDVANVFSRGTLEDVMYVGDSITDVEPLRFVRDGGGLAISLNGNGNAVRNAQVAVLSSDSTAVAIIADIFLRLGKGEALNVIGNWDRDSLWRSLADPVLLDRLFELYPKSLPKASLVSEWNMEQLVNESNEFRKTVQGEAVGKSVKLGKI